MLLEINNYMYHSLFLIILSLVAVLYREDPEFVQAGTGNFKDE